MADVGLMFTNQPTQPGSMYGNMQGLPGAQFPATPPGASLPPPDPANPIPPRLPPADPAFPIAHNTSWYYESNPPAPAPSPSYTPYQFQQFQPSIAPDTTGASGLNSTTGAGQGTGSGVTTTAPPPPTTVTAPAPAPGPTDTTTAAPAAAPGPNAQQIAKAVWSEQQRQLAHSQAVAQGTPDANSGLLYQAPNSGLSGISVQGSNPGQVSNMGNGTGISTSAPPPPPVQNFGAPAPRAPNMPIVRRGNQAQIVQNPDGTQSVSYGPPPQVRALASR